MKVNNRIMEKLVEDSAGHSFQRARERSILLILGAVQFTSVVDFMVVMPLGPELMRELSITPAQFGLVVSSYTLAAGVTGNVAMSLIDRVARKTAFLTLFFGFLLGTLMCGLAPTYRWLVVARIATGAFGGILNGMALAIIGDVFPEERRGRATGTLMSSFALASVAGVPFGIYLGMNYGWHIPFLSLVALGTPIFVLATFVLPRLDAHLNGERRSFVETIASTFGDLSNWNAFALIASLMFGGFAIFPYLPQYLVANVGLPENRLAFLYVAGGAFTFFTAPAVGRLADRFGKLQVFFVLAPCSAAMMVVLTHLPPVSAAIVLLSFVALMVVNTGRMVAAMAMITGSVVSERRGGFMSANSSIQHLAAGVGSYVGGLLIAQSADGRLHNFGAVGYAAACVTLASLWFASRVRPAYEEVHTTTVQDVAAAAEANYDAGDPLASVK